MSVKYSLTGPDATAKQIRDIRKTQRENSIATGGGSDNIGQYLPGGSGFIHTDSVWTQRYTSSTSGQSKALPYDSSYDKDVSVTVSKSGIVLVNITAWVSVVISLYYSGYDIGVRTGIMPVYWYDGDSIPNLADGQYGGCQLHHEANAGNHTSTVGANLSNVIVLSGLTPGRKLNIRSRRYYWGWLGTPTSGSSYWPSNTYYTITIGGMSMQAMPTYAQK